MAHVISTLIGKDKNKMDKVFTISRLFAICVAMDLLREKIMINNFDDSQTTNEFSCRGFFDCDNKVYSVTVKDRGLMESKIRRVPLNNDFDSHSLLISDKLNKILSLRIRSITCGFVESEKDRRKIVDNMNFGGNGYCRKNN